MKLVELLLSFTKPHEAQPESALTTDKWSNETLTQAQLAILRKTAQPVWPAQEVMSLDGVTAVV